MYIDGLVKDWGNSNADALELSQSYDKPYGSAVFALELLPVPKKWVPGTQGV